jgi:very-short-patch-repair endonuclease
VTGLARVAAAQGGVFSRRQLLNLGVHPSTIQRRVLVGEWLRVVPGGGVYAHATTPLTTRSWVWTACLLVGEPCALAISSAAWLWTWTEHGDPPIELIVPPDRHVASTPLVVVRRLQVTRSSLTRRTGLPVTTPARTLADCIRFLPAADAVTVLDRAQQRSRVSLARVAELVPHYGAGTGQARRLLAAATGEHSPAERLATSLLRRAKIRGWRTNFAIQLEGRHVVIDIAFPESKVAIEIDGWAFHIDADAFQRDRWRQNLLVRHEWRVLRFTYRDLIERPPAVVAEIVAATRQSTD